MTKLELLSALVALACLAAIWDGHRLAVFALPPLFLITHLSRPRSGRSPS